MKIKELIIGVLLGYVAMQSFAFYADGVSFSSIGKTVFFILLALPAPVFAIFSSPWIVPIWVIFGGTMFVALKVLDLGRYLTVFFAIYFVLWELFGAYSIVQLTGGA